MNRLLLILVSLVLAACTPTFRVTTPIPVTVMMGDEARHAAACETPTVALCGGAALPAPHVSPTTRKLGANYPSSVNLAGAPTSVYGILPAAQGGLGIATGGTSGYVPTWSGSAWVAQLPSGGINALTGDVTASGSGAVAATVAALGGGNWTVQSSGIGIHGIYNSGGGALTLTAPGSDLPVGALSIAPGNAFAGASTNRTGAELDLYGGAGATTNGTGGNVDVVLAVPSGTGTDATFNIDRGLGTHAVSLNPSTGLWTFGSATTAPGLAQASESATQTPTPTTITPQVSTHTTNQDGSELLVPLSASLGSGVDAKMVVTRGGSNSFQVGGDLNGHTCIWLDQSSPSYMNCDLRKVSSDIWVVPPGSIRFLPDQSNVAIFNGATGEVSFGFNNAIGAFSGGTYGGGTATTYWANGTGSSTQCTGGTCVDSQASTGLVATSAVFDVDTLSPVAVAAGGSGTGAASASTKPRFRCTGSTVSAQTMTCTLAVPSHKTCTYKADVVSRVSTAGGAASVDDSYHKYITGTVNGASGTVVVVPSVTAVLEVDSSTSQTANTFAASASTSNVVFTFTGTASSGTNQNAIDGQMFCH